MANIKNVALIFLNFAQIFILQWFSNKLQVADRKKGYKSIRLEMMKSTQHDHAYLYIQLYIRIYHMRILTRTHELQHM